MTDRKRLIPHERSLVVSIDFPGLGAIRELVRAMREVQGPIGAFKIGKIPTMRDGLPAVVDVVRSEFGEPVPIIYDDQKAGNDIPDLAVPFATEVHYAQCDAVIIYPFAGLKTQKAWTEACRDVGLTVLVGAEMTHEDHLLKDGGYLCNDLMRRVLNSAISSGVTNFVLPGTKLESIELGMHILNSRLGRGNFDVYSPGIITQGGVLEFGALHVGRYYHPIVGRALANLRLSSERTAKATALLALFAATPPKAA